MKYLIQFNFNFKSIKGITQSDIHTGLYTLRQAMRICAKNDKYRFAKA